MSFGSLEVSSTGRVYIFRASHEWENHAPTLQRSDDSLKALQLGTSDTLCSLYADARNLKLLHHTIRQPNAPLHHAIPPNGVPDLVCNYVSCVHRCCRLFRPFGSLLTPHISDLIDAKRTQQMRSLDITTSRALIQGSHIFQSLPSHESLTLFPM